MARDGLAAGGGTPALRAGVALARASQAPAPRIEVVFVLDTTGSMGGLIEGAKAKIWSIANQMIAGEAATRSSASASSATATAATSTSPSSST